MLNQVRMCDVDVASSKPVTGSTLRRPAIEVVEFRAEADATTALRSAGGGGHPHRRAIDGLDQLTPVFTDKGDNAEFGHSKTGYLADANQPQVLIHDQPEHLPIQGHPVAVRPYLGLTSLDRAFAHLLGALANQTHPATAAWEG